MRGEDEMQTGWVQSYFTNLKRRSNAEPRSVERNGQGDEEFVPDESQGAANGRTGEESGSGVQRMGAVTWLSKVV